VVAALAMRPRLIAVRNPRAGGAAGEAMWQRARRGLEAGGEVVEWLETRGDGGDLDRLGAALASARPEVLLAAGGDGTVGDAVAALLRLEPAARPALALLPMGTGNNVARALGLRAVRSAGEDAVDEAVAAALAGGGMRGGAVAAGETEVPPRRAGARRRIDVGLANGRSFVGSFALGMDADILALRNRLCRRLGLGGGLSGYALYLASCAANLLAPHGGEARLRLDGREEAVQIYNLVVTNTPLYAGEFRFDGDDHADDGRLDLHCVAGARDYLREHPAAWRRHVRHGRGERVAPSPLLRRAAAIEVELGRPVAAQVDGEELAPAARFELRVVPAAIAVCAP